MRSVGAGAIILMTVVGSACSSPAKADCAQPQVATTVTVSDFAYRPGCIAAVAGATLSVVNQDSAPHTFTIRGTNVDVTIGSDETGSVPLTGLAPGTYSVICRFHPQMVGGLRVG